MHWFIKLSLVFFSLFLIWVFISRVIPWMLPTEKISDSRVWGIVFKNQIWSGTISVQGDLITLPGVVTTILPGTKVIINRDSDRSNFDFLPWHLKSGLNTGGYYHGVYNGELFWDESQKIHLHFANLVALGTKQQPIIITSNSPTGGDSPYDINSIAIESGVISNVYASNYRRLEIGDGVTISDSNFNNISECAICIGDGSPSVIRNKFGLSLREDIWVSGASPKITDNVFLNSRGEGVMVEPAMIGSPDISHNDFEMPTRVSVEFLSGDEDMGGNVSYNNFVDSTIIKIPCDSKVNFSQNKLLAVITFQNGGCAQTLKIGSNFWGTSDIGVILKERILNRDQNLNLVISTPLESPPSDIGPRK